MPDKMSAEKTRLLKAYGADVVMTPASNSLEGCSGVAARLANQIPSAWQPNRLANLDNPEFHNRVTGPEIRPQTDGKLTAFAAEIGTGGRLVLDGTWSAFHQPSDASSPSDQGGAGGGRRILEPPSAVSSARVARPHLPVRSSIQPIRSVQKYTSRPRQGQEHGTGRDGAGEGDQATVAQCVSHPLQHRACTML